MSRFPCAPTSTRRILAECISETVPYIAFHAVIFAHDMSRLIHTHTFVGRNCFIGAHAIILPGVQLATNASSVLDRLSPRMCRRDQIVAGNPARVVRSGIRTQKWGILVEAYEEAVAMENADRGAGLPSSGMNNIPLLGALAVLAVAVVIVFTARAVWINKKISALRLPPQRVFAAANAALPGKGPRPRVVLIGDSRISQWPQNSWEEPWEIVNRGIGGETVSQLAKRFRSDAVAFDLDAIVIESGVNDLVAASFMSAAESGAVARRTAEALFELVEVGLTSGAVVCVATIIPPARPELMRLLVWRESLRILVAEVNANLRNLQWPARAILFDFSRILGATDDKTLPNAYRADTLHLNRLAYEKLARLRTH